MKTLLYFSLSLSYLISFSLTLSQCDVLVQIHSDYSCDYFNTHTHTHNKYKHYKHFLHYNFPIFCGIISWKSCTYTIPLI